MLLEKHILTTSLIILIIGIFGVSEAKSLYAITDHALSTLKSYDIHFEQLTYQADADVPNLGTGAVDVTIASDLKLLFITYAWSGIIVWVNAETLAQEGSIRIPGAQDIAGVVVDEGKQRVYAVERWHDRLYICAWDADKEKLVLMDPPYIILADLGGSGALGLALDENNSRLYVGNNTPLVHYYHTDDWRHLGTRNVGRPTADVAFDPNNGQHNAYLYTGALYSGPGQGHNFLVKHDLEAHVGDPCNTENDIGTVPIGLAVDSDSGLVYTTTSDWQIRVYNCSQSPFICTHSESIGGSSAGAGICVPTKDISYKRSLALSKTDNVSSDGDLSPGDYVTYTISYGNPVTNPNNLNYIGDVNGVVIVDYLPSETDFSSALGGGLYDSNLHTVAWELGMLSPGDAGKVTVTVKVNKNAEPGRTITNRCEVESQSAYSTAKVDTPVYAWCSWNPRPADGTKSVDDSPTLTWSGGDRASQYDVYFGADQVVVADTNTSDVTGIYRGRQDANSYEPETLQWGHTYYWRIDDLNTDGSISMGRVWSFTVADYLIVDDFESYTDDLGNRIFQTWMDGLGYTEPAPGFGGNSTGSTVGYTAAPFTERTLVHGGTQSMPFNYNNITLPFYSETQRTFDVPQDWIRKAVKTLALWFHGDLGNSAEQLYIGVQDSAGVTFVVSHANPSATMFNTWQQWNIDLKQFSNAGIDLTNVKKMYIGVGNRAGQQPGGSGMLYFDDIRLYR
ncbi:MAG: hypothetical protein ACE5NM_00230 [Sedimentisphaerales bacterium]